MSSNHLNLYVIRNAKSLNSFETLCATMFGPKRGKFNQRQQLAYLREMAIYMSAVATMDETIFSAMISFMKELGDNDADRKSFRTVLFLIVEAIASYGSRGDLPAKKGSIMNLQTAIEKELKKNAWSSKQVLLWRTMGSITHVYKAQPLQSQSDGGLRGTEIETSLKARLLSTFEELQYPVKQKKSVLFGEDKDFLPKLLSWAGVVSGLVRCGDPLPRKSWDNLYCGLTCTNYKPLAQHSFRLLLLTAKSLTDPKQQLEFVNLMLVGRDAGKGKDALQTADPVCCTYYIRTLAALAQNCIEIRTANVTTAAVAQAAPQSELARTLVKLLVESLRYLDAEVKVVIELVAALFNATNGAQLIALCNQYLRAHRKRGEPRQHVVALVTQALSRLIGAQQTNESTDLPALLRACETVGKFLVRRPYGNPRDHQKDGDCIASLWLALRRHYNHCLWPKDNAVGSEDQRMGRGVELRQNRAPAGANGSAAHCAGYVAPSYWSWPSDNASVAAEAVAPNPHIFCALLRAQIWMAPDKRYCPKEHTQLWASFSDSLLASWQLISTTLAKDYDVQVFLLPLLSQLFARVQASITTTAPAAHAPATAFSGGISLLDMTGSSATAQAVTEVHVRYERVYVDVLLALSEQLVTTTQSAPAVMLMQSVWKWVASFTSTRVHPQQAALQLKCDRTATSAATFGGSGGLLMPTTNTSAVTAGATSTAEGPYEQHADRAFLQSVCRMCMTAQQVLHVHTASVPLALGTPSSPEACKVMQALHQQCLWHLADNALLCDSLAREDTKAESTSAGAVAEHTLMIVKILGEVAKDHCSGTTRFTATMGLVKVTAKLVLRAASAIAPATAEKSAPHALLRAIAGELTTVYVTQFGHTLDLHHQHLVCRLASAARFDATQAERAALSSPQEAEHVLATLLSHIHAPAVAPSVYTTLRSAMTVLCAYLQNPGTPLSDEHRAFLTVQADNQHNAFALVVPAPQPTVEDEDRDEPEPEPELVHDELTALTAPKSGALFSFDDDLLGGWAPPASRPAATTAPAAAVTTGGSLLDDIWLMDAPTLMPTTTSTTSTAFDVFGGSAPLVATKAGGDFAPAVPYLPRPPERRVSLFRDIYDEDDSAPQPAATQQSTNTAAQTSQGAFDFSPTQNNAGDGFSSTGFDWPGASAASAGSSSDPFGGAFGASPVSAGTSTAAVAMEWPGASDTAISFGSPTGTGVGDDGFAPTTTTTATSTATTTFASPAAPASAWPEDATTSSLPEPAARDGIDLFDGFAISSAPQPTSASTANRRASTGSYTVPHSTDLLTARDDTAIATPVAHSDLSAWSGSGDSGQSVPALSAPAASLEAWPTESTTSTATDDGRWGAIPDGFGFDTRPNTGKEPNRRASTGAAPVAGSLETLSKCDVAAIAAAKRANRRQSVGGSASAGKAAAGGAVDPFLNMTAPTLQPQKAPAPATDTWPSAPSVVVPTTADSNQSGFGVANDPFFAPAAPAVDGWATTTSISSSSSSAAPSAVQDGFQATPADFAASTSASTNTTAAAPTATAPDQHAYGSYPQPAYGGYPPNGYPPQAYPPYPGYDANYPNSSYPPYNPAYPPYPGAPTAHTAYGNGAPPAYDPHAAAAGYYPSPAPGGGVTPPGAYPPGQYGAPYGQPQQGAYYPPSQYPPAAYPYGAPPPQQHHPQPGGAPPAGAGGSHYPGAQW